MRQAHVRCPLVVVLGVLLASLGSTPTWALPAGEGGASACGGPCRCANDPDGPGCPGRVRATPARPDPPFYFVNHWPGEVVLVKVENDHQLRTCILKPNEDCQVWLDSEVAGATVCWAYSSGGTGCGIPWRVHAERVYEIADAKLWGPLTGFDAHEVLQRWKK